MAIPLQEVVLDSVIGYQRFLECIERYQAEGVHALPARVEYDPERREAFIVGRIAGPFEALCNALVYFHTIETLSRTLNLPVLDAEPHAF